MKLAPVTVATSTMHRALEKGSRLAGGSARLSIAVSGRTAGGVGVLPAAADVGRSFSPSSLGDRAVACGRTADSGSSLSPGMAAAHKETWSFGACNHKASRDEHGFHHRRKPAPAPPSTNSFLSLGSRCRSTSNCLGPSDEPEPANRSGWRGSTSQLVLGCFLLAGRKRMASVRRG